MKIFKKIKKIIRKKIIFYITKKANNFIFEDKISKNVKKFSELEFRINPDNLISKIDELNNIKNDLNLLFVLRVHRHSEVINYESGSNKASKLLEENIKKIKPNAVFCNKLFDETKNFNFSFINFILTIFSFIELKNKQNFSNNLTILIDTPGPSGFFLLILNLFFPQSKILRYSHNFEFFHRYEKVKYFFSTYNLKKKIQNIKWFLRSFFSELLSIIITDKLACISSVDSNLYKKIFFKKNFLLPYYLSENYSYNKNIKNNLKKEIDLLILRNNKKTNNKFLNKIDLLLDKKEINVVSLDSDIKLKNIKQIKNYNYSDVIKKAKGVIILDEFGYGFKTKILEAAFSCPVYLKKRYLTLFKNYKFAYDFNIIFQKKFDLRGTIEKKKLEWNLLDIDSYNNHNKELYLKNIKKFIV